MEGSWSSSGSNSRRSGLGSAPMGGGEPFEALHRGSPQYQHYQPRHSGGGLLPSSSPSASHLSGSMISQHQQAASRSSLGKLIERSTSAPPSSSSARGDGTYPYPYNGSGNSSGSAHSHHNRPHPTASYASSYAYHHGEPPLLGEATATDSSSLSLVGTDLLEQLSSPTTTRGISSGNGSGYRDMLDDLSSDPLLKPPRGNGSSLGYIPSSLPSGGSLTPSMDHPASSLDPADLGTFLAAGSHSGRSTAPSSDASSSANYLHSGFLSPGGSSSLSLARPLSAGGSIGGYGGGGGGYPDAIGVGRQHASSTTPSQHQQSNDDAFSSSGALVGGPLLLLRSQSAAPQNLYLLPQYDDSDLLVRSQSAAPTLEGGDSAMSSSSSASLLGPPPGLGGGDWAPSASALQLMRAGSASPSPATHPQSSSSSHSPHHHPRQHYFGPGGGGGPPGSSGSGALRPAAKTPMDLIQEDFPGSSGGESQPPPSTEQSRPHRTRRATPMPASSSHSNSPPLPNKPRSPVVAYDDPYAATTTSRLHHPSSLRDQSDASSNVGGNGHPHATVHFQDDSSPLHTLVQHQQHSRTLNLPPPPSSSSSSMDGFGLHQQQQHHPVHVQSGQQLHHPSSSIGPLAYGGSARPLSAPVATSDYQHHPLQQQRRHDSPPELRYTGAPMTAPVSHHPPHLYYGAGSSAAPGPSLAEPVHQRLVHPHSLQATQVVRAPNGQTLYVNAAPGQGPPTGGAGPYAYTTTTIHYHHGPPHPDGPGSHHSHPATLQQQQLHQSHRQVVHHGGMVNGGAGPPMESYLSVVPLSTSVGGHGGGSSPPLAASGYHLSSPDNYSVAPVDMAMLGRGGGAHPSSSTIVRTQHTQLHQSSNLHVHDGQSTSLVNGSASYGNPGGGGGGAGANGGRGRDKGGSGRGRRSGGGHGGGGGSHPHPNGRRSGGGAEGKHHHHGAALCSTRLEEFRAMKNRDWTMFQIAGYVVEFCQDQNGSRFIQQRLEMGDPSEQQVVAKEVLPAIRRLRNDVFGNYVVQKLLDFGSPQVKTAIRDTLEGEMLQLSLQMYGCRVVQKALEALEEEDVCRLLSEFHYNVLSCIHDQNGNHVIQKCIEVLSKRAKKEQIAGDSVKAAQVNQQINFIIDDVLVNTVTLSCHPYGCRVLQRILEHCNPGRKEEVLNEIQKWHRKLLDDQYGNYVIQHVLQFGRESDRDGILAIVVANGLLGLSRQKFASNVVEKLLKYGNERHRRAVVREMLKKSDEPLLSMNPAIASSGSSASTVNTIGCSVVLLMVRDAYANYVVQTTLDVVPESEEKVLLLQELSAHSEELRQYTFAKHIVAKLSTMTIGA